MNATCNYCEFRCNLAAGHGRCGMYAYDAASDTVRERYPFTWTRAQAVYAENIPIFHRWPGERFLQIGGFNCNARCAYCINAGVAIPGGEIATFELSAERICALAERGGYRGLHFGVNELTVNLPSALAAARLARQRGLITGCSSNGFFTEQVAGQLCGRMDFFNISLKSLSDDFYRRELSLPSVAPVLRNIRTIAGKRHLELTTPITAGNAEEIPALAAFIAGLDAEVAWHVFRLQPANEMADDAPPQVDELRARLDAAPLKPRHIYLGNFVGSRWVNTHCAACGAMLIERVCAESCGAKFIADHRRDGCCPVCGAQVFAEQTLEGE